MKHLSKILLTLTVVAVGALLSLDAGAYTYFSGSNNCNQCHDGFDSYGASTHQSHIAITSCGDCHDSSGDNPAIENCGNCHHPYELQVEHLYNGAGQDGMGFSCNNCHTITPTEAWSFSRTKKSFH